MNAADGYPLLREYCFESIMTTCFPLHYELRQCARSLYQLPQISWLGFRFSWEDATKWLPRGSGPGAV